MSLNETSQEAAPDIEIRPVRILRIRDVMARSGKSRSGIYRDIRNGLFPRPVRTGANTSGWLESELAEWQAARIAERDSPALKQGRA